MSAAAASADAPPRPPVTPKQAPPAAPPPPEGASVSRAPTPPDWSFRLLVILGALWGVLLAFHLR